MQTRYKEEIFYYDGGKMLKHFAQRDVTWFIPASVQVQVGQGSDKPDQVDVSVH